MQLYEIQFTELNYSESIKGKKKTQQAVRTQPGMVVHTWGGGVITAITTVDVQLLPAVTSACCHFLGLEHPAFPAA